MNIHKTTSTILQEPKTLLGLQSDEFGWWILEGEQKIIHLNALQIDVLMSLLKESQASQVSFDDMVKQVA